MWITRPKAKYSVIPISQEILSWGLNQGYPGTTWSCTSWITVQIILLENCNDVYNNLTQIFSTQAGVVLHHGYIPEKVPQTKHKISI